MEKQSKGNIQTPTFPLLIQEHPLSEPTVHNIAVGIRISDILKNAPKHSGAEPQVLVNGEKAHGNYKPKEDDIVNFTFLPAGVEVSGWVLAAIFLASAAISYALMPDIGDQQGGVGDENKFERISGLKNKSPLYEPYQAILGKRKVAPVYISRPYTTVEGDREYFHALLSAGYGPLKLEDFRIGETAIADFDDVEITVLDHHENTDESAIREVWQQDISQQLVQIELREEEGWTNRTTETNPSTIVSNFLFPSGVFGMSDDGNNTSETVLVRQDVQAENGDWWTPVYYYRGSTYIFYPVKGTVTEVNGQYRLWTDGGFEINLNNSTAVSNNSIVLNQESIDRRGEEGVIYFKGLSESLFVATMRKVGVDRTPSLKAIRLGVLEQLWPNKQPINVRARKIAPTQAQVEDNRGAANVNWENLQTIRPLTDEGFKEAIGYNRPKLRYDGNVVRNFRPTLIAVRMRATGQLNGNLDDFFCDATMVVPESKNADWRNWPNLTLEPSSNPADAYKWLMQGPMNYSPIPNDKIDNSKLSDWRSRCVSENWSISALLDYESTLLAELQNVAYTGRAEFQFNEGKFGVVEKIERTVPRQIFTPKNSANFQSKRVYPEVVDGVKFQFESAAVDYEKDEGIFLDPAKDPDNGGDASLLKGRYTTNELWGIDNFDQAYRLTRFEYYERFLQREIYTLDLDAEVLASNRGDLVRVQNDIINVGLGAGRVKAIDGSVVTLDETINTDNLPQNTGLQFRDDVGVITTTTASYLGNGQWDCNTLDAGVTVGDLAVYGEAGKEATDCIIRGIKYNEDLGASLTLVNAANEIYSFDGNPIPVYNPSIALPTDTTQPSAPIISANASRGDIRVVVNSPNEAYYNSYRVFIQVREYPVGIAPEDYFESDNEGWSYEAQGENSQSLFTLQNLNRGVNYQVRAQFRGQSNTLSAWSNIEELFLPLGDVPLIITEIDYSHTLEGTYLLYTQVKDIEFSGYEIRTDDNFGVEDANFVGITKDNSFFVGLRTTPETYYVAAKNNYGDYGQEVAIATPVNEPNKPAGVTSKLEGLTVRLSWSKASGGYAIDYFEVRFNNWDETDRTLASSELLGSSDGLTFLHSIGIAGTYTYYVRAVDIAGNTSSYVTVEQLVEVGSDNIRDELDNVETVIDTIDTDLNDLDFKVTENSVKTSDFELTALDSIVQQSASREELRRRVEYDEELIDAAVYVDPESGTIVNRAFAYTDDRFTQAQIEIDGVEAQITLAVDDISLLEDEVQTLSSEIDLIPGQITATANAVVADAIQALEPAHTFNFFDSSQGWVAVNGAISTAVPNEISVTWGDIENDSLNFVADDNPVIRVTIERTAGTGWTGDVIIERDDTTTETFIGIIEAPPETGEIVRSIDFRGLSNWTGTINRVRLVMGASTSDEFTIKQVIIGKPDALLEEVSGLTARVTEAELDISANDGRISQVVTELQTFEDDTADQFTQVSSEVDAANASITNSVFQIVGNSTDFEDAQLQQLDAQVSGAEARAGQIDRNVSFADAISRLEVDVSEEGALARSINGLEAVTNTQSGLISANSSFIQEVETNVNGNASSISKIASGVTGEVGEAEALVKLDSYLTEGGLASRAFLGTDINGRITGVVVNDDGTNRQIEFQSDTVVFLDGNSQPMIYFDNTEGRYVFNGEIVAQAGSFTGSITSSEGSIGGWSIEPNHMSSAESGQRIELDAGNSRIGVYDTVNERVVMGYLDGLPKNDGTGNWGAGDYGFWARAGDGLTIDGTIDYTSGDFLVENDASISIRDDQSREIVRLGTDNGTKGTFIYDTSGITIAEFSADKIEVGGGVGDSLTYENGNLDISGGITADRGEIGGWSIGGTSLTSGDTSLNSSTETLTLGSEVSLNKDAVNFGTGFSWDSTNGLVVDGDAEIAGWIVETDLFKSATSGARIELNATNNRVSVFDTVNEKVAMGYLGGLPKYDGSGGWSSNDYGFWARQGDNLVIDGDMEYNNGDFIIENDASIRIRDGVNANEIMRWGTDAGVKGMFIYDASVADGSASNRIAEFSASRIEVGRNDEKLVYENGELDIEGGITADRGEIGGWTIGSRSLSNAVEGFGAIELNAAVPRIRIDDENGNARFVARPDQLTVGDKSNDYMEWKEGQGLDISGNISGGSIDLGNGTFTVDNNGNMVANSGTFGGDLNAAGGTFSGDISAASGTFSGSIYAQNLIGETTVGGVGPIIPTSVTNSSNTWTRFAKIYIRSDSFDRTFAISRSVMINFDNGSSATYMNPICRVLVGSTVVGTKSCRDTEVLTNSYDFFVPAFEITVPKNQTRYIYLEIQKPNTGTLSISSNEFLNVVGFRQNNKVEFFTS